MRMLTGYKEIPKKTFSCQTTVLDFLKSSVETRASPFVPLDIGDDYPNNQPIVQEKWLLRRTLSFHVFCKLFTNMNISSYWPQLTFHNHTPHFDTAFMEKYVSTCVVPTNLADFRDSVTTLGGITELINSYVWKTPTNSHRQNMF